MTNHRDLPLKRKIQPLARLVEDAFQNIFAVRQRAILALIGIVIGTASVIAMFNVGHTAAMESARQFKAMGTDLVVMRTFSDNENVTVPISITDIQALPSVLTGISGTTPLLFSTVKASFQQQNIDASIVGATASLSAVANLALVQGRFISAFDKIETFAVIGQGIANTLSTPQRRVQLGDAIRIENYMFTVIGFMSETKANPLMPVDFNNAIIVPLARIQRLLPNAEISTAVARLDSHKDPLVASREISDYFKPRVPGNAIHVDTARQLIDATKKQDQLFTYLLAGVGSISLLVGGVGVMNVMLMGVMERRREIGLRMAIGAQRKDICAMFLVEAVTLSVIGGSVGTLFGIGIAYLITSLSGWQFEWVIGALPLGVGMALIIGLVSGLYPAVIASRLKPIAALRAE